MTSGLHIDMNSDIPIYQQLVDELRAAIKRGSLPSGTQLPTVLVMAGELGVARGTVKRAYDELERLGLVEKAQGRGTFVCYQPPDTGNRKEEAMAAIDAMLDRMEALGFSAAEVNIFLHLKLREREEHLANVKVAVIECNQENLSRLSDQLREVEGVELYSYLLSHVEAYPYDLDEEADLVVTTSEHAAYVESILSSKKKLARIALRLSPGSMAQIVKLQAGEQVGVLGCSQRFAQLLHGACVQYTEHVALSPPEIMRGDLDLDAFLVGKSAVLVPDGFEKYASAKTVARLRQFARDGKLLRCAYEMDEGSFLYLQERISRLREKKLG